MKENPGSKLKVTKNIEVKLIEGAVEKRNEILAKADEEAKRIIQLAEQECHQIRAQFNEKIAMYHHSEIQILRDRIIGEAELEGRKTIIREREEAISLAFQKAEDRLRDITKQGDSHNSWREYLIKLVVEAALAIGGNTFVISTNKRDVDLINDQQEVMVEKIAKVLGNIQFIVLDQSIETMGGVIVQNKDGTKIYYNTLESRLKTVRDKSEAVVAKILEVL